MTNPKDEEIVFEVVRVRSIEVAVTGGMKDHPRTVYRDRIFRAITTILHPDGRHAAKVYTLKLYGFDGLKIGDKLRLRTEQEDISDNLEEKGSARNKRTSLRVRRTAKRGRKS